MYTAKDKALFQEFLAEQGLLEAATDIPYYKINALVKEKKLTSDQISSYLDRKPSRRLSPSKKKDEKPLL